MEFVASRMLGVTVLPAVLDVVVEGSVDGLEVRYVGEDGTQHDARATADDLDSAVTRADRALAALDRAVARIHHRSGLPRSTDPTRRE